MNDPSRSPSPEPVWSRDSAFVVHLADVAAESADQAHGRVEHVMTGRTARFGSAEELLRFMRQTLASIASDDRDLP